MIEDPQRVSPRPTDKQRVQVLESCAFTWIFDGPTQLFRRIPRHSHTPLDVPATWTPYWQLEIDEARNSFVVALNDTGTRLLRAWLHTDPCVRCGPERQSLWEDQRDIQWWKGQLNVVNRRSAVARVGRNRLLRPFSGWFGTEGAS